MKVFFFASNYKDYDDGFSLKKKKKSHDLSIARCLFINLLIISCTMECDDWCKIRLYSAHNNLTLKLFGYNFFGIR